MATAGTKLHLKFLSASGNTITMSFGYSKEEPRKSDIVALIDVIIQNGEIFKNVPVSVKRAYTETTQQFEFDLD